MSCRKNISGQSGRCRKGEDLNPGIGKQHRHGGKMRTLLFGALFGLVAGLLLAPRPGPETLEKLNRKRGRLLEKLIRTLPV